MGQGMFAGMLSVRRLVDAEPNVFTIFNGSGGCRLQLPYANFTGKSTVWASGSSWFTRTLRLPGRARNGKMASCNTHPSEG